MGYEDCIEDGFYEVWGMSFYVWFMCIDFNEFGCMFLLELFWSVNFVEVEFEVVFVDRNGDLYFCEFEDKVVGFVYDF